MRTIFFSFQLSFLVVGIVLQGFGRSPTIPLIISAAFGLISTVTRPTKTAIAPRFQLEVKFQQGSKTIKYTEVHCRVCAFPWRWEGLYGDSSVIQCPNCGNSGLASDVRREMRQHLQLMTKRRCKNCKGLPEEHVNDKCLFSPGSYEAQEYE